MLKALNRVGASMYVSEVRELVDSLLFRAERLEAARDQWVTHDQIATSQATSPVDAFSSALLSEALHETMVQHTVVFDTFEALLAGWARLSLLFHPVGEKGELAVWRQQRGQILRSILGLSNDSLLSSRSFRDSWMHFDERLDQAYLDAWLGNRQQFVRTADVAAAVKQSVRVIDIENLTLHYRTRDGNQESVSIAQMRECLVAIQEGLKEVGPKIMTLPPPA